MKMESNIQDDLSVCLVTGNPNVCIHHIFPNKGRRRKCERYGFIVAITPEVHEQCHLKPNTGIDLVLKQMAQVYFEAHFGNRKAFISEFGRSYL